MSVNKPLRTEKDASKPGFRIERIGDGQPLFARIHHKAIPACSAADAAADLLAAQAALGSTDDGLVLLAGAGYGKTTLKTPTIRRRPQPDEFQKCMETADAWLVAFSEKAKGLRHQVLFGLDVYASCKASPSSQEVVQLVAHYDPKPRRASIVAIKRLPTSEESGFLYCDDLPNGFPKDVNLPGLGKTLPLVCHDMNVYNPRAIAASCPDSPQTARRELIAKDLHRSGLKVAFAAIHSLWPSAITFRTSMKAMGRQHKGRIEPLAAFGTDPSSLSGVLEIAAKHTPAGWSSLELVPSSWPASRPSTSR